MNVTIDLAKKHLQDIPENSEVIKADLIKVIKAAEELEQQLKNCNLQNVVINKVALPTLDALFDKAKHHMNVVCNLQNFEDEDSILLYSGKYVDGYIGAIKDFVNGEYAPE